MLPEQLSSLRIEFSLPVKCLYTEIKCINLLFLQGKEKTMSALQKLLQDLGKELQSVQSEDVEFGNVAKTPQAKAAEVRTVFNLRVRRRYSGKSR